MRNEQKNLDVSKNVTRVLNQLLKGYDKRIRPNYAGEFNNFAKKRVL